MYPKERLSVLDTKLNHVVGSPFVITITECVILCTLLRILMKARRVNWTLRLLCVIFDNEPSVGFDRENWIKDVRFWNIYANYDNQ